MARYAQMATVVRPPCVLGAARRAPSGFSLVELLVVISIIGALVAILLPSLVKARKSANTIYCLSNLRQIGTAAMGYVNENKGYLLDKNRFTPITFGKVDGSNWVIGQASSSSVTAGGAFPCAGWLDEIYQRMGKNIGVLECPEQAEPRLQSGNNFELLQSRGGPLLLPRRSNYPGYLQTSCTHTYRSTVAAMRILKITEIKAPTQKIWFGDGGRIDISGTPTETYRAAMAYGYGFTIPNPNVGVLSYRHGKENSPKCNVAYFDGHAETINPKTVEPVADLTSGGAPQADKDIWAAAWDPDGDGDINTP